VFIHSIISSYLLACIYLNLSGVLASQLTQFIFLMYFFFFVNGSTVHVVPRCFPSKTNLVETIASVVFQVFSSWIPLKSKTSCKKPFKIGKLLTQFIFRGEVISIYTNSDIAKQIKENCFGLETIFCRFFKYYTLSGLNSLSLLQVVIIKC